MPRSPAPAVERISAGELHHRLVEQYAPPSVLVNDELDVVIDGKRRTYDFRIERNEWGIGTVGFDITPSKLAEASLLDADHRKDEFLATRSHELRNPLTPLKLALDIAKLTKGEPARLDMSLQIFEIFVQCRDASGRARGGLGIGLNLVRRITELHDGRVFVSSAGPGLGSEFVVELPLHDPALSSPGSRAALAASG